MLVLGKKIAGISIKHPFRNIVIKLETEKKNDLIEKLRAGTISKLEEVELIESYLRLAVSIACKYARSQPYNIEVLIAEASFGVFWAVHKAKGRLPHDNFHCYCLMFIHGFLTRELKRSARSNHSDQVDKAVVDGQFRYIDTLDQVMSTVKTEDEVEIIKMRVMGYKDDEIAENLDKSTQSINKTRNKLEERYDHVARTMCDPK